MITGRLAAPEDAAPFSDAVLVQGSLAFLAGQGPISNGEVVLGTIEEQAALTLHNLGVCLARLGLDATAVVSCTCYLADLSGLAAFNAAYLEFFSTHRPARTTVQAELIGGIAVEITAVAALPSADAGMQRQAER
jgi:2-iminobutanoate/2-iminopropanoate deaminase